MCAMESLEDMRFRQRFESTRVSQEKQYIMRFTLAKSELKDLNKHYVKRGSIKHHCCGCPGNGNVFKEDDQFYPNIPFEFIGSKKYLTGTWLLSVGTGAVLSGTSVVRALT